jgi:hypothetical protein
MNKQFKIISHFLVLLGFCVSISGCGDENNNGGVEPELPGGAGLYDLTLSQTVNGEENYVLNASWSDQLLFSSQLGFNQKTVNWSQPTLEQTFGSAFDLSEENVSVTDATGATVSSVNVTIEHGTNSNTLRVAFTKTGGSYNYLSSNTYTLKVATSIKSSLTSQEQDTLKEFGYEVQTLFYGEPAGQRKLSNIVSVDAPYDVTGDPRNSEYANRLNVIYFIPPGQQGVPGYMRRISTLLLKHQLFICKWMRHYGYEEKSFGLPLKKNGAVKIITVRGTGDPRMYPPFVGTHNTMKTDIDQYYADNKTPRYSDHYLVLAAITTMTSGISAPFYGSGRWCYATDIVASLPMAYENMKIDPTTNLPIKGSSGISNYQIGGMFHELGHALNEPHVGESLTEHNDPGFKMSLMGAGNQTYGQTATFLHHSSAAIMNNCQISTFDASKQFYSTVTTTLSVNAPEIDNVNHTVKVSGSFTAPTLAPVTDVAIYFYNAEETFGGGADCYTSVAFVAKPTASKTFELTIPIKELSVRSYGFSDGTGYRLGVFILMNNGTRSSHSPTPVYTVVPDGQDYKLELKTSQ